MSHTRHPNARQRLQRSELAVPVSNPFLFEKAAASDADYVFLDLEDAVAPGDKEAAADGRGAAQPDGRMIDAASARMAENIVATAEAIEQR